MILFCWQIAHPFTYSAIHCRIPVHGRISMAFRIVSSCPGCPAVGWSWMRVMRFLLEESGICVAWVVLMKSFGLRRVWSLLLSSPWSEFGGRDSSSAGVLIFSGMCLITKSYSWRSACHCAVRQFSFCGAFQYCKLAWLVRIVNGVFVHPK